MSVYNGSVSIDNDAFIAFDQHRELAVGILAFGRETSCIIALKDIVATSRTPEEILSLITWNAMHLETLCRPQSQHACTF